MWGAYPVQLINDNDATGGRIALSKLPECAQGKPGPATDIAIDADILSNRLAISDASEAIASAASLATGPDVPVMLTQSTYSPPQISFPPPSVEEEDAMDTILVSVNKGMDMLLLTMSELSATTDPTLKEMYAEFSDMANIVKARFRESWREYAEDDRIPDSIRSDLFLATYPNLAPYVVGDFLFSAILEDELGKKFRKIRVHDYVEDPMPLPE